MSAPGEALNRSLLWLPLLVLAQVHIHNLQYFCPEILVDCLLNKGANVSADDLMILHDRQSHLDCSQPAY